jgi:hypothetical protein
MNRYHLEAISSCLNQKKISDDVIQHILTFLCSIPLTINISKCRIIDRMNLSIYKSNTIVIIHNPLQINIDQVLFSHANKKKSQYTRKQRSRKSCNTKKSHVYQRNHDNQLMIEQTNESGYESYSEDEDYTWFFDDDYWLDGGNLVYSDYCDSPYPQRRLSCQMNAYCQCQMCNDSDDDCDHGYNNGFPCSCNSIYDF